MFTGIIENSAKIIYLGERKSKKSEAPVMEGVQNLVVENIFADKKIKHGASIAVNGCCLTVAALKKKHLHFFLNHETIFRTSFQYLKEGDSVNLERALRLSDRLDGHIVTGHIDGLAMVIELNKQPTGWDLITIFPEQSQPLLIPKGSICLDGISLTINEVLQVESKDLEASLIANLPHDLRGQASFQAIKTTLIPTTIDLTTFFEIAPGKPLNYELDIIGKYLIKQSKFLNSKAG